MDPLHPMVPIQPAAPPPPEYARIQRIDRDQQREPQPDWEESPDDDSESGAEQQLEDDYDPDWDRRAPRDGGYGPDAHAHDPPPEQDRPSDAAEAWDPQRQGERRQSESREPESASDEDDQGEHPHIDISA